MARLRSYVLSIIVSLLFVQQTFGNLQCEDLPIEDCAFAVSSSGARCVLEKYITKEGGTRVECQTSIIMAEKHMEWIETDECVKACGVERMSFGLSTDSLLENEFTNKLCSSSCQENCDNIVDLYTKLAAGEGVYLPHLCKAERQHKFIQGNHHGDSKLSAPAPSSSKGFDQGVGDATPWAPSPTPGV